MSAPTPPRLVPGRPLPTYRYVPGAAPHPIRDPRGHLYGVEPTPSPAPDGTRWHEEFRFGIDLFNHRYYWEAHEVWEGLWHGEHPDSPRRHQLQGLIQLAAALLKHEMGSARATETLFAAARDRLVRSSGQGCQLVHDLASTLQAAEAHLRAGEKHPPTLSPA